MQINGLSTWLGRGPDGPRPSWKTQFLQVEAGKFGMLVSE